MINKGNKENHFDEPLLTYRLFERLRKEKYENKSFLEIASKFIDDFGSQLDSEFKNQYLFPYRDDCIASLLKGKGQIYNQEEKEEIIKCLKSANYESSVEYNQKNIEFISLNTKYIHRYSKALNRLIEKYEKGKGKNLLYAFQLIGIIENFSVVDHFFHNIESFKGIGCLISPSHVHYLSNPEQTIFIYVRTGLHYGTTIKKLLDKHKPKINRIYLFTLDPDLEFFEIADFKYYGVKLVTTNSIKMKWYSRNKEIITLEELFKLCKSKQNYGNGYEFSEKEQKCLRELFRYKISYFYECSKLKNFYQKQIEKLDNNEYKTIAEIINRE